MRRYFVDSNIFLRFLLGDEPRQSRLAKSIFLRAEKNEIGLWTTRAVVLELVWTLGSFYKLPPKEIRLKVFSVLNLKNLKVEEKDLFLKALDLYVKKRVDFIDAYNFLLAQKEKVPIFSFDADFDKLGKREKIK